MNLRPHSWSKGGKDGFLREHCEVQNNLSWASRVGLLSICCVVPLEGPQGHSQGLWADPEINILCLQASATQFHVDQRQPSQ